VKKQHALGAIYCHKISLNKIKVQMDRLCCHSKRLAKKKSVHQTYMVETKWFVAFRENYLQSENILMT
jgi:hypothetical protein